MWVGDFFWLNKFVSEIFLGQKNLGREFCWVKQNLGRKFYWVKKNLGQQKSWLQKHFLTKFFWGQKIWVGNFFRPKKMGQNFLGSIKFGSETFFKVKKNVGQKKLLGHKRNGGQFFFCMNHLVVLN